MQEQSKGCSIFLWEEEGGGMGKWLVMIFVNIVILRSVSCIINVIREKCDVDRMVEKEMEQLKTIKQKSEK